MNPSKAELKAILDLRFSILISTRGEPVVNNAKDAIQSSIEKALTLISQE
jgi:hypothetical protein